MKKYDIMGHQMVKVSELRWVIRRLRKDVPILYKNFDKEKQAMVQLAYNDIVRHLYLEELKAAESPEEIEAILEMPGTFVVYRKGDKGRTDITFFSEFADGGKPVVTRNANLREQYAAQLVGMLKIVYGITTETYGGPDR